MYATRTHIAFSSPDPHTGSAFFSPFALFAHKITLFLFPFFRLFSFAVSTNILRNSLLLLRREALRDEALDGAAVSLVGGHHVLLDPGGHILDVGKVVVGEGLASVERGKRGAEADVVNGRLGNHVVAAAGRDGGRVGQEREQDAARVAPALHKLLGKDLRVAERLGQRDDGELPVDGAGKLLRLGQDEWRVDLRKGLLVQLVRVLDEVVGAVSRIQTRADEVEEAHEAELERLRGCALQLGVEELHDCAKVLVENGSVVIMSVKHTADTMNGQWYVRFK